MKIFNVALLFMLCIHHLGATVRLVEIENRTPTGFYSIDLSLQNRVLIPPSSIVRLDDLLGFNLHPQINIACIQGDYDPIYIEFHQNIFKCDNLHYSYVVAMWMGAQVAFENQKTLIPLCCKEDAGLRLVIHEDGTPEITIVSEAYFMIA